MKRTFLALATLSLALLHAGFPAAADTPTPAPKPNIILILADDLGAKELSCYGSTRHQTPNLDRMAAEGMRFETFYAMPLCTPTRVALMTGQYGFHNGFLGMANAAFRPAIDSPQAKTENTCRPSPTSSAPTCSTTSSSISRSVTRTARSSSITPPCSLTSLA